jgi:putative sterol carrier protein
MAHEFLSDEWIDALEALRDEAPEPPAAMKDLAINLVVIECPFGDREAHIKGGQLERGLMEGAPTTLTVPYDIAKKIFIEQDPQAGMQAFMAGQIKIDGDMTKVMAMQSAGQNPTAEQKAFQDKLRALTA